MFEFIKNIFKEEDKNKALISLLIKDHRKLFELYAELHKTLESENFEDIRLAMQHFINAYHQHILLEDTKLYVALEEKYKGKKTILDTIKVIEKDMNEITRSINFFERKYMSLTPDKLNSCIEELNHIGEILSQRVELEENRLYNLL
jgi:NAD+--asparagine ADP-ribosyltransferase